MAKQSGPTVSFLIPTHRGGAETLSDSQHLHPLLTEARTHLAEHHPDVDADELLSPVVSLAKSRQFWQTQCDGLAVFAYPGGSRHFRVDRSFTPQVTVGDHPNLRPILPLATIDMDFLILALSQSKVRLFEANRATITELPLEDLPASSEDVEGVSTREPQFQHQSGIHSSAHGHGPRDYNVLNGFLQVVSKTMEKRFTGDRRPVVLAAVDEYQGALREHLRSVTMLDTVVSGNPDRLSELELHAAAWPIVAAETTRRNGVLVERLGEALGTGLATNDPTLISSESASGRVEILILAERALSDVARTDELDAAIANTLVNRGQIEVVPELPGGHAVGAIFRH